MSRRWLCLLHCLVVCLCVVPFVVVSSGTSAQPASSIRVDESLIRFTPADNSATVSLAVENTAERATNVRLRLELLDPQDKIISQTSVSANVKRGANRIAGTLALPSLARYATDRRALLWYRLRYRVEPDQSSSSAFNAVGGMVSVSEIARDLFELRVAASKRVREGQLLHVRVSATHPLTERAVRGVRLEGEVTFDDAKGDTQTITARGETDADGAAALDFQLPRSIPDDDVHVSVTGRLGGVMREASDSLDLDRRIRILLSTDKPLYQPGQTVHLRALVVTNADRALALAEGKLKIEDPEDTTVFDTTLKTSRFGVASAEWKLPDNTRLGDYSITFELDSDKYGEAGDMGRAQVKISRYELPNFAVTTKPDRDYYLRGESASVEVRADYLFGQPVKRGHARVVRETERRWNFAEQKYDVEEAEKYEGDLDDAGRFVAHVDLSKAHAELAEESWRRFEDLTFAAYVRDATTNRTEQRRFRLRVTRDPIHVYLTQANEQQSRALPLEFFVAASYADGSPAECEVKIEEKLSADELKANASAHKPLVKTVKTNRLGVAKVTMAAPTWHDNEDSREIALHLTARDREGKSGAHDDELWLSEKPVVHVKTDKSIYREGEPIEAEITSDKPDLKVVVETVANDRSLSAQTLRLSNGRAVVSIPYRADFQNRVTVAAYSAAIPKDTDDDAFLKATRTVIYPRNRELNLDVNFSSATYKPGEEARARVSAKTARGRAAETALGVVVFDKAVEERARTEQEFGSSYGFYDQFRSFWYGDDAVGGVTLRDLERLHPAETVTPELDTVAELLLQRENYYEPEFFGGDNYETDQSRVFSNLAADELKAARQALSTRYEQTGEYPRNEGSLRRALGEAGISASSLLDPWGTPYRGVFSVEQSFDVIEFLSAGADKKFDTADDWKAGKIKFAYFRPQGETISRVVSDYQRRTNDFIRDVQTLKTEMLRAGFDFNTLRDRWGNAYALRFAVNGASYTFTVWSAGPDGRFSQDGSFGSDDFSLWSVWTDYFAAPRREIDTALEAFHRATGNFPKDESTLSETLRRAGLRFDALRDPWGHPYHATFNTESRYGDRAQTEQRADSATHTQVTPVTRKLDHVAIRSAGADGVVNTSDDFSVADFSSVQSEQSAQDREPRATPKVTTFVSGTGAISGTVTDPQGASVANATVTATHQYLPDATFNTTTDAEGVYLLRNLPSGLYTLRVDSPGFKSAVIMGVAVHSESLAQVDLRLEVGAITETVEITSGVAEEIAQTSSSISTRQISELPLNSRNVLDLASLKPGAASRARVNAVTRSGVEPISTPRLRDNFTETLYWQPELVTDARGRSEIKFKLADNITTWKMSIIGSNERGEIGTVEKEFRAFQPFFVELDPPPVLTEGDEIILPVVVRNYLDTPQRVALDIRPESWFTLLTPASRETQVAAGDATRETFDMRAVASVEKGKQQVTARGADAGDAIEKTVFVHPDGEEIADTTTQLVGQQGALDVNVPASVIRGSLRAEVKIYPNLLAHVVEGVEAIMRRPYGCGEQTISSTYPSLLVLRHYKQLGASDAQLPPAAAKARTYLQQGYERLLSYRASDGGFTYWGRGDSDTALTAYALRFLEDARDLIDVDDDAIKDARAWLFKHQRDDGSWIGHTWSNTNDPRGDATLTAYVARILARGERRQVEQSAKNGQTANNQTNANSATTTNATSASDAANANAQKSPSQTPSQTRTPFERALDYLARRSTEFDEPYMISAYALALTDSGAPAEKIAPVIERLRSLARDERGGSYWSLETNTPFFGWGLAGRIETTALAVTALARSQGMGVRGWGLGKTEDQPSSSPSSSPTPNPHPLTPVSQPLTPTDEELVSRGLLFLLKNKDAYGVWYSTQATVNVFDALMNLSPARVASAVAPNSADATRAAASSAQTTNAQTSGAQTAEVFINGQSAGAISIPTDASLAAPISIDISRFVAAGANRVEIRRAGVGAQARAAAQVVADYYVPWSQSSDADGMLSSSRSVRALRLAVAFDKTRTDVSEEVTCHVEAERVGHQGYGMLLAEVGLPPGADVDRASLERAMKSSGWDFSHYDILPDRLVVYLWARAGGTKFDFTFRPRFGLNAKSAPSQIYDYYNPEARATLPSQTFVVSERAAHTLARKE